MAETMEQTLESQERYEDQGPCFYYGAEDEDRQFFWNGVYGDPIHVENCSDMEVIDIIPTGVDQQPQMAADKHLQFFKTVADIYLRQQKGESVSIVATDQETGEETVIAVDNDISTGQPLDDGYTKTKPSQHDSGPDLTRFFPEEDPPR